MLRAPRVTAQEIARAAGVVVRSIQRRAAAEAWSGIDETTRGGRRRLYDVASLPADMREALMRSLAQGEAGPSVPALAVPIGAAGDRERRTLEARAALLQHLDALAEVGGLMRALGEMVELSRRGALPAPLQALVPIANARSGESGARALSERSLRRWRDARRAHGADALAPRAPQPRDVPEWAPLLMRLHANPQKRPLAWAVEALARELAGTGIVAPSYDQARRFLGRMSTVDRERGRMGPRKLKTLRPYVKRDTSDLLPLDVIEMDGHQYDAEVAHPAHGKPFRPEITHSIDAATRVMLAYSAGLAESAHAVMDCYAAGVIAHGVPAILYVDNGSGYKAHANADQALGLFARVGSTLTHSLPYNSQARGLIERLNKVWIEDAAELPSFMGDRMDPEARQKVHKLTRRDLDQAMRRRAMPTWREFLARLAEGQAAYNNRPHRGLPRLRDPETGAWRHQTPAEAWAAHVERGWQPHRITVDDALDLFRPHREATVIRGQVQLHGQSYFAAALEHWNGERVQVAYDMRDGSRVWVKALDGRLIAVAEFEANKRAFFPMSVIDKAREDRAAGRERRLAAKLDEIQAERSGGAIEAEPLTADVVDLADWKLAELAPEPLALPAPQAAAGGRPAFADDADLVAWLKAHPDQISDADRAWVREQALSAEWRALHEIHDVTDLTTGGTVAG